MRIFSWLRSSTKPEMVPSLAEDAFLSMRSSKKKLGVIAGNGPFPKEFILGAKTHGYEIAAVCHKGETDLSVPKLVKAARWIKVGQLGALIDAFLEAEVKEVAMAGGINRINLFGGVKLDARGAALLARIASSKDDTIMRGIADELAREGISVISCTRFLSESICPEGQLTICSPSETEQVDIATGIEAIKAMSSQHIGQMVVVREGVVVAVEAVEGTDRTIVRGGELGGKGTVVVKFAKLTQDMRFDVPTVGMRTIEVMRKARARVLALEAGRTVLLDREEVIKAADRAGIAIVGCTPLGPVLGVEEMQANKTV